jgi:threonine dehydratase
MTKKPDIGDIEKAADRIQAYIRQTPVRTSVQVNQKTGCEVYFKCENFQRAGAFKFRGACNAVLSLSDEAASRGVVTHSSGNHAQALSLAASIRGIPAYIVMPENAPEVKISAVKGYGGRITFCEATQESRESAAEAVKNETGAAFIHPYNNPEIIAGQGTAAFELIRQVPDLDILITPVGGGGLISGTAVAAKFNRRQLRITGAEPEMADDAYQSFKAGKLIKPGRVDTIADGLRTSLSDLTFQLICDNVHEIVTVSEESIIRDMRFIWERMNMIIEASSAVPVSALFDHKIDIKGKKAGVIISGGNTDLNKLPWQA